MKSFFFNRRVLIFYFVSALIISAGFVFVKIAPQFFNGGKIAIVENNTTVKKPQVAEAIEENKKIFASSEDPKFRVGELSAAKKIAVSDAAGGDGKEII